MSRDKLPKGQGMWVWKHYNIPSLSIVLKARDAGLGHVLIKFADGMSDHASGEVSYHDGLSFLIQGLRSRGIEVWGWAYVYGNDPAGEAEAQANWVKKFGFDGFVIDAEKEYKGHPQKAAQYSSKIRSMLPDTAIALSSYKFRSYHPSFPWAEFLRDCDFVMPQVYWWGSDPVTDLQKSIYEFSTFNKPIIPTGVTCNYSGYKITQDEMKRFASECGTSFNWWYWEGCNNEDWDTIKEISSMGSNEEESKILCPRLVAGVAKLVAAAGGNGNFYGVDFDNEPGYCTRNVRKVLGAAVRAANEPLSVGDGGPTSDEMIAWPWLALYASTACRNLENGGTGRFGAYNRVDEPAPGDIIAMSPGYVAPGHIGIFVGRGLFFENTSSQSRGPGTHIASIDEVQHKITGYYRVLEAKDDIKILSPNNTEIDCNPKWDGGKIVCQARELAEGLGYKADYKKWPDGRDRIYIKEKTQ